MLNSNNHNLTNKPWISEGATLRRLLEAEQIQGFFAFKSRVSNALSLEANKLDKKRQKQWEPRLYPLTTPDLIPGLVQVDPIGPIVRSDKETIGVGWGPINQPRCNWQPSQGFIAKDTE
jgi:hypothetical protein